MSDIDPLGLERRRARARPDDHEQRGHGATTDPGAIRAYVLATARRRRESSRAAVRVGERRHYSEDERRRCAILLDKAAALRRIAADKPYRDQRALVEAEADALERSAEEIVPARHR